MEEAREHLSPTMQRPTGECLYVWELTPSERYQRRFRRETFSIEDDGSVQGGVGETLLWEYEAMQLPMGRVLIPHFKQLQQRFAQSSYLSSFFYHWDQPDACLLVATAFSPYGSTPPSPELMLQWLGELREPEASDSLFSLN